MIRCSLALGLVVVLVGCGPSSHGAATGTGTSTSTSTSSGTTTASGTTYGSTSNGSDTGMSVECAFGEYLCGDVCSTLDNDPYNCGACGRICALAAYGAGGCDAGDCMPSVGPCAGPKSGFGNCEEVCQSIGQHCANESREYDYEDPFYVKGDEPNCGSLTDSQHIDAACNAPFDWSPNQQGWIATGILCDCTNPASVPTIPTPACPTGYAQCGNDCKVLNTDPENCGTCGHLCPLAPLGGGDCGGGTCTPGFGPCALPGSGVHDCESLCQTIGQHCYPDPQDGQVAHYVYFGAPSNDATMACEFADDQLFYWANDCGADFHWDVTNGAGETVIGARCTCTNDG